MQDSPLTPHTPPIASAHLPGIGGKIGPELSDFIVDEIPLYLPSGSGEHVYVRLKKRGKNTQDCIHAVARASGIAPRDIGCAGMKDKHAITSQWLSLPSRMPVPPESWQLPTEIEILEVTRHNNKLRTGHLSGNRFKLRLVELDTDALPKTQAIRDYLEQVGLPNYFGAQRFGIGGKNLSSALRWARDPSSRGSRFYNKLYPSVIQAEIFNRYLSARRLAGVDRLMAGEVVRLEGSRAVFSVDDPGKEQPRYDAGDLHLTGPIFGPKMRPATLDAAELENRAVQGLDLDPSALDKLGAHGPGTRRDLRVRLEDLQVEAGPEGSLYWSFGLPAGSYATQVVRELTRTEFIAHAGEDRLDSISNE